MANTYCALYRKYRPETLDDVVGQKVIVRTLKNAIKNDHISHAYLFTGPRGTGKTSVAKILAKTINCTNLNETMPCNNCVSCTQINNKQNIDIIEIDAASNNGVDEIREIRSKVGLVPSISKYKVYIIDEVHMLTTGAFNALLKTLEEPPSHIIFILATTEPHKIPNTILSRCQRFDFKRINIDDIFARLKNICVNENIEISDEAIMQIAVSSDGGMRDAISMLDQVISYSENNITIDDVHEINGTLSTEELSNFVNLIINKDLTSILEKTNQYYNGGKNIVKISEEIVIFLKNILLYKIAPKYIVNNQYNHEMFVKYSNVNNDELIEYISLFNEEINEIKKSNLPKFIFELLLIKLVSSNKNVTYQEKKTNEDNNKNIQKEDLVKEEKDDKSFDNNVKENKKTYVENNEITKIQQLRIDNTLARFNKQETLKLRQKFNELNSLLMIPDLSQTVSMILDGELKAASDEYIILVFETLNSTNLFNDNIVKVEEVLGDFIEKKYKVIGIEINDWNKIKNDFNSKSRAFEYKLEEEIIDKKITKKDSSANDIEKMFGETIEYEG